MSDKLLFLKNVLGQVEELGAKQKELQQAKDQINLTGNVELRGEMTIGTLTIPLNDLSKDIPSTISSNLKMVLSQYVDHLIKKNGQLQQDLLSNIQIAHMQDLPTSGTSGEHLSPFSDEKKNYSEPAIQPVSPSVVEKIEIPSAPIILKVEEKIEEAHVVSETVYKNIHEIQQEKQEEPKKLDKPEEVQQEIVPLVEKEEEEKKTYSLPSEEELQSRFDQVSYKEKIRKIIAEEFYGYEKGAYIHPKEVQRNLEKKIGRTIEMDEINDLAWLLIAQDAIEFVYHTHCDNGHDEYLLPPLPKNISCQVCQQNVSDVDISYRKLV